eukprot:scaffold7507_cov56-Phaeocystis_antarctica.AAC.4
MSAWYSARPVVVAMVERVKRPPRPGRYAVTGDHSATTRYRLLTVARPLDQVEVARAAAVRRLVGEVEAAQRRAQLRSEARVELVVVEAAALPKARRARVSSRRRPAWDPACESGV